MSNNASLRGARARAVALEGAQPADPVAVAATIAEIEAAAPQPAPAPRTAAAPKEVAPVHVPVNGRGAFRWVQTGQNEGQYRWDENAKAIEATPLPLSSDIVGLLRIVAANNGLEKQRFLDYCRERTQEVRAACREHRDNGGQRTAFDGLVAAFKQSGA